MDKKTKKAASDKVKSMASHIGYPSELLDDKKLEEFYEKLEIREDDYFQSTLNLTLFHIDKYFQRLNKPVNKSDWVDHGSSAVVNAFYNPNENSISKFLWVLKLQICIRIKHCNKFILI